VRFEDIRSLALNTSSAKRTATEKTHREHGVLCSLSYISVFSVSFFPWQVFSMRRNFRITGIIDIFGSLALSSPNIVCVLASLR